MKSRILICIAFLLGMLGIESLKMEQLQHFWSTFSGLTLPMHKTTESQDIICPEKQQDFPVAELKHDLILHRKNTTCFILYNPKNSGFITCKNLILNPEFNTNFL